jgi:hypothetical protein
MAKPNLTRNYYFAKLIKKNFFFCPKDYSSNFALLNCIHEKKTGITGIGCGRCATDAVF